MNTLWLLTWTIPLHMSRLSSQASRHCLVHCDDYCHVKTNGMVLATTSLLLPRNSMPVYAQRKKLLVLHEMVIPRWGQICSLMKTLDIYVGWRRVYKKLVANSNELFTSTSCLFKCVIMSLTSNYIPLCFSAAFFSWVLQILAKLVVLRQYPFCWE
jgi:hypothetical protein